MATVRVNRELLDDVVRALVLLHADSVLRRQCCRSMNPCPIAQRITRIQGVMERELQSERP